jgi:2-polyprenyl-6-methoxyphenol hydroxylase-like FAD-dependent oxidoreductase
VCLAPSLTKTCEAIKGDPPIYQLYASFCECRQSCITHVPFQEERWQPAKANPAIICVLMLPQVMARFAASRGGTFPAPQYTTHLSWTPDQASMDTKQRQQGAKPNKPEPMGSGTSVVLVGDAAHSFPPDLGQGVNSALEDVVVLGGALEAAGDDPAAAANLYQERRLQDASALARLMQVGREPRCWRLLAMQCLSACDEADTACQRACPAIQTPARGS